ncbi:MAG: HAD family hydrolase [Deltaproteobacteria bacterium]|nr:HAD family hydrolase [Deltaproteobacteria bacterium]
MTIKAVSFDLWDTLVIDDSDEIERGKRGLRTKKEERRHLVWEALSRHGEIELDSVRLAYNVADAAFNKVWHDQHVTWPIEDRLRVLLAGLGQTLPADELAAVVRAHQVMEVEIPPAPMPAVAATLATLRQRYKLCVTSDAVVTPGTELRRLLAKHQLDRHFDAFVFSDEVGHSKPHPSVFEAVAKALNVALPEIVHVGDRQHNDVAGPQRLGMKTVLFVGSRAVDRDQSTADAICAHLSELPAAIRRIAEQPTV